MNFPGLGGRHTHAMRQTHSFTFARLMKRGGSGRALQPQPSPVNWPAGGDAGRGGGSATWMCFTLRTMHCRRFHCRNCNGFTDRIFLNKGPFMSITFELIYKVSVFIQSFRKIPIVEEEAFLKIKSALSYCIPPVCLRTIIPCSFRERNPGLKWFIG